MAVFASTRRDVADVPHSVADVWDVLVDPAAVARLTPLVSSIEVDSRERWIWRLQGVPLPGRRLDLTMTERMTFAPQRRIDFTHDPLGGSSRAGAHGHYLLEPVQDGTRLTIELTVSVQLPLPGLARPAVEPAMQQVLHQMGQRFAAGLGKELARAGEDR